jgi:formylmethanofuran:tetrahydromethanopterin formyltransferase
MSATPPSPAPSPAQFSNWIVEVTVGVDFGVVSVLVWVAGVATPEQASANAKASIEALKAATGKVAVNGLPVNMGAN